MLIGHIHDGKNCDHEWNRLDKLKVFLRLLKVLHGRANQTIDMCALLPQV
jgi:hypothetical protein